MIVCPSCEHRNPEGAESCEVCGASLDRSVYRACPSCGALNAADDLYCRRCLAELRSQSEGVSVQPQESAGGETPEIPEDPLEGLGDVLPLRPSVTIPHRLHPLLPAGSDEAGRQGAALFERLADGATSLGGEGLLPGIREATDAGRRRLAPSIRYFLWLLALLAVLLPLLLDSRPTAVNVDAPMQGLQPGEPVLLSVDYGPAYATALEPTTVALVEELLRRGVPTLVMSTSPAGLGQAERLVRAVETEGDVDLLLLGYLPGDEAGLRTLRAGFTAAFPASGLQRESRTAAAGLGDLQRIYLVTGQPGLLARWVEQIGYWSEAPLDAVVTSRIYPLALPYADSGQIRRVIAERGSLGGIEGEGADLISAWLDAAPLALFLLVVLVSNVAAWSASPRRAA